MSDSNENKNQNENRDRFFTILGLTTAERKVLSASKMAKSVSILSRVTKIPVTSLPYILIKLQKRGLMKKMGSGHKTTLWMHDLRKATQTVSYFLKNFKGF